MAWAAVGGATTGWLLNNFAGPDGGTQTQTNIPWGPYQQPLIDMTNEIQGNIGSREYYPGDMVANLTPEQLKSISMMTGAADKIGAQADTLSQSMGRFMSPEFMDPNANPYMKQYVDSAIRPVTQAYTENVLPSIRSGARMTGGSDYGSTRQGVAEGIAARGYNDTVGDITSGIYTDLYGKNIDTQLKTMSMNPMLAQMMGVPAAMYGEAGNVLQAQNQAETNADVNKYNWNRDLSTEDMYRLINTMQGSPYGTQTSTNPNGGGSDISSMLGGAFLGSSIYDNFNDNTPWAGDFLSEDMSIWGGE